jgi:hypothetical protein
MMFCKYRHIFGEERKTFHSLRVLDVAVGDFVGTIIIGVLIAYVFQINTLITCFGLFVVAIFLHRLFCVNTKINTILFGVV